MATSSTSAMSTGAEDRQKVWELIQGIHIAMLVTQAPQSFVSEILLRPTQKP